jgi:ribosomal protein S18 acetylase RimI-like enzyme
MPRMISGDILDLTRDRCLDLMDQLIEVGRDYSEWGPHEFLAELPDKYMLSFAVMDVKVSGYAVMSRKWPDRVHIHHFMVHHAMRSSGLGKEMLLETTRRAGPKPLTLKVPDFNIDAIRFYERHGFRKENLENNIFWMRKDPAAQSPKS